MTLLDIPQFNEVYIGKHRGKILDVDSSTGAVKTIKIEEDVLRQFVGGSGLRD